MTRRAVAMAVLLLLAMPAFAQEESEETPTVETPTVTSIRTLIERSGVLMVERRIEMPAIALEDGGRVVISGVGAFEPGMERQRTLGLRIDTVSADGSETTRHYLDLHEVETLLRAIAAQDELVAGGPGEIVTETRYATVEGFLVGSELRGDATRHRIRGSADADWRGISDPAFTQLRARIASARDRLFNAP